MIRLAKADDAEAVARIIVKSWQEAYTGIIDPDYPKSMSEHKFIDIMTNNIVNNVETVFVYEDKEGIKGFISGKQLDGKYDCEAVGLYILPDYQKSGIGSALLDKMKKHFISMKCKKMIIWTFLNAGNNRFYKKHGGLALETKTITLNNHDYEGAGFVFGLGGI